MPNAKKRQAYRRGLWGEFFAALFLRGKGYQIIAKRWRCRRGEIDIVARKGDTLAMIEVKTRPTKDLAALSITPYQQKRIHNAAMVFLAFYPFSEGLSVRYDVVYVSPWSWPEHVPRAWDAPT